MALLQTAYRYILHHCCEFAQIKRADKADDIFKVIRFERDLPAGASEVIQVEDFGHAEQMIKDPKITKLYYSDNILEKFKYLAFIQLGIEYLTKHAEFEGALVGKRILDEKIVEEKNKFGGNQVEPRSIP